MGRCQRCGKTTRGLVLFCSDSCKTIFNSQKRAMKILKNPGKYMESLPVTTEEITKRLEQKLDVISFPKIIRGSNPSIQLKQNKYMEMLKIKEGDVVKVTIEVVYRS